MMKIALIIASFFIVALGQPAWSSFLGLVASCLGYALFWRVLIEFKGKKERFFLATLWFMVAHMVQLSWFVFHPYLYIWAVYVIFGAFVGVQFGLVSLLVEKEKLKHFSTLLLVASLWTLMEWMRLFFFSGYSWNPAGLALSGNLYSLQMASLFGVYGLTFWVMLTNLFALRAMMGKISSAPVWLMLAVTPYLYGYSHVMLHEERVVGSEPFSAVLVQTAFPIEETCSFCDMQSYLDYVIGEWKDILKMLKQNQGKKIDLIVLPEYVVPFGTFTFVYPIESVEQIFEEILGVNPGLKAGDYFWEGLEPLPSDFEKTPPLREGSPSAFGKGARIKDLPALEWPLAHQSKGWFVNNAYWVQAIANAFNAHVVVGLEDVEDKEEIREHYSAAFFVRPHQDPFVANRYDKRVLVPMGEYIPFSFCRQLAAGYGITGSFTRGTKPAVWQMPKTAIAASICYEETFGNLMRENRLAGAKMLVNITNDGWYPGSKLPRQHLEHARLRTVENGFPLIRACNTGITGGLDCFGREIATLGDHEELADSLQLNVPTYTYQTLYSRVGDGLIVGFSLLVTLLCFRKNLL